MPHLTLEYSANVDCPSNLADLFKRLHGVLVEKGGIKLENCKSRGRVAEDFFVASGRESDGFVHLDIRFLEGRPPEVKRVVGQESCDLLIEWFHDSVEKLDLQITVEVRDIRRTFYFKHPEGTLTPV